MPGKFVDGIQAAGAIPAYVRDVVRPSLAQPHDHSLEMSGSRKAEYRGHQISIRTSYRIFVDGRRVYTMLQVDNDGQLTCHAMPNYTFLSAVDMVKQMIDTFPDDFPDGAPSGHMHGANPPHGGGGHS